MSDHPKTRARSFPETQWSLVLRARDAPTKIRQGALDELCRSYWPAIYGYARFRGHSPAEAEDLTQGFFVSLLEREGFEKVEPETSRLRTWLIGAFGNWRIDQHRRKEAQRRGGGWIAVEINGANGEEFWEGIGSRADAGELAESESAFDRIWALSIMAAARRAVGATYASRGNAVQFAALEPALGLERNVDGLSERAATGLGMTPAAVRKAIQRLRQSYAEKIREEIARTLSDAADVEGEFRALREALR